MISELYKSVPKDFPKMSPKDFVKTFPKSFSAANPWLTTEQR
jgi:hypothetical protein